MKDSYERSKKILEDAGINVTVTGWLISPRSLEPVRSSYTF